LIRYQIIEQLPISQRAAMLKRPRFRKKSVPPVSTRHAGNSVCAT
jgi:hypothetical protein